MVRAHANELLFHGGPSNLDDMKYSARDFVCDAPGQTNTSDCDDVA